MKKTAIALAVAAIAAAPLAAQADAGAYASIRVAVTQFDDGGKDAQGNDIDAVWSVENEASRFGFKGSEDLGNGMKAVGRYEFAVDGSTARLISADAQRLSYAGLEGGFGGVYLGSQWSPFYLLMASALDQFNGVGLNQMDTTFRLADALAYTNTFGGVKFAVAGTMHNEDDDLFQDIQVGASIPAGPVTIGVAHHSKTEVADAAGTDGSRTGASVTWNGGMVTVAGSVIISSDSFSSGGSAEDETDLGAYVAVNLGGGQKVHASVETTDDGGSAEPMTLSLGYQKSLSKSSRLWAEFMNADPDTSDDASTTLSLGIRKDW